MVWASILLLFRVFRKRFGQKSFPPTVFHRLFDRISHGLGIDPSSFLMRSLGDVRQFSGLCFVWFGHQSCCCSSVSQLRTKDCFPSAFRSYFAWFGHLACVSYGLGINPAAVRVFRNCGQTIVFHRLFDRISHGLGIDPSSFLMRSLGNVRHFSGFCFVWFGHQSCCCSPRVSELRTKDCFPSAFRSYFAWFGHQSF